MNLAEAAACLKEIKELVGTVILTTNIKTSVPLQIDPKMGVWEETPDVVCYYRKNATSTRNAVSQEDKVMVLLYDIVDNSEGLTEIEKFLDKKTKE